jgi:hypothetical protein
MTGNIKISITVLVLLLAGMMLTGCHDDDQDNSTIQQTEVVTLNVDVVLPADILKQWQSTIDWAQENIANAQRQLPRQVKLNLRYHDEDTEDMEALSRRLVGLTGADSCHAIIGPYRSENAQVCLAHAAKTRLPVVMPTCSSAELQRIYAKSTYAWFFTESDITQCEIMLATASASEDTDVVLVYSDDSYGRSFYDWFAYFAAEYNLNIVGEGFTTFKSGDDLNDFLDNIRKEANGKYVRVCVALGKAEDYQEVDRQLWENKYSEKNLFDKVSFLPIYAGTSLDAHFIDMWNPRTSSFKLGISPYGSVNYGFPQVYNGRFGHMPINGDAQIYDALTTLALSAAYQMASPDKCLIDGKPVEYHEKPYTLGVTDYMRSVVASETGLDTYWDESGLTIAFNELYHGRSVNVSGATGNLYFDQETHTKILNTTYMEWMLNTSWDEFANGFERVIPVIYLSTLGSTDDASTTLLWLQEKMWEQQFENVSYHRQYPAITDRWAVVISPSTTWNNYRHQADAFAMYQLLKRHGYDDDHIVLIVEDNLADSERNKAFPGQIFVQRSDDIDNDDVRKGAIVDYHFSDLTPDDIGDILLGNESERLPQVIHSTATSNVFFFWSGHGGSREGPLWGDEDSRTYFGTTRIHDIVEGLSQKNGYRRMIFAIETCYGGKWGEALSGFDDLLVLTAANPHETSKADVYDRQLGVYLSNAFARTFRLDIEQMPDISLYSLYKDLARTTTGSHVTLYNHARYGSVYTETMKEYFPK